ncbi:MAG TPA: protein-tyrosine-phosphatase [Rhodospirillaceae bacterium]|nr:protein-tyrosine-phosphatase [Rhodospirillaceae bacterium]
MPYPISVCGLEELSCLAGGGVSHVISILDPDWPDPPEFAGFSGIWRKVLRFHDVIDETVGMVAPSAADIGVVVDLARHLQATRVERLLVHCHAGVSRSTAVVAILLAGVTPFDDTRIFAEIARIRPWSWPNSRMVAFADALLDRRGLLVAALRAHHRRMIDIWPERAALIRDSGRAREYLLAG